MGALTRLREAIVKSLFLSLTLLALNSGAAEPKCHERSPMIRSALGFYGDECDPWTSEALAEKSKLSVTIFENRKLSPADFKEFKGLKELIILAETELEITPDFLGAMPNLEKLEITVVGNLILSPGGFRGLTGLRDLSLKATEIDEFPAGVFLGASRLEKLLLEATISEARFSDRFFEGQARLEKLNMKVPFKKVSPELFKPLTSLMDLDLSMCQLNDRIWKALPPGSPIVRLNLTANSIGHIDAEVLLRLPNLNALQLANNSLTDLSRENFRGLKLENLDLSNNEIRPLSSDAFIDLASTLETLSLGANLVGDSVWEAIRPLKKLRYLDIFSLGIRTLPADILPGMPALAHFFASENQITELHPGTFRGLKLRVVSLARNSIERLPEGLFAEAQVESLRIGGAQLEEIPAFYFTRVEGLKEVEITPGTPLRRTTNAGLLGVKDLRMELPKTFSVEMTPEGWGL